MKCSKCGTENLQNSNFCSKCGNILNNNVTTNNVENIETLGMNINDLSNQNIYDNNTELNSSVEETSNSNLNSVITKKNIEKKNNKKSLIVVGVILILVFGLFILLGMYTKLSSKTKTMMLYMVGSDLESNSGQASYNLYDLLNSKLDLENINIVIYAGGSSNWYTDEISKEETSIYQVKNNKIVKVEERDITNMGTSESLEYFLNYVYDNYKTDEYYLTFWNHGAGLNGVEFDELSNDNITLSELDKGLKNSNFNKNNIKFDLVIFATCLMGNLETMNIMSNYANYMVASQDIGYVSPLIKHYKYLDRITGNSTPIEIGKKYIDLYVNDSEINYDFNITMSLVDLNKVKILIQELDNYIEMLDVNNKNDFIQLAKIRNDLYEYQKDDDRYDLVDLLQLVKNMGSVNVSNQNLVNAIKSSIVYNYSNDGNSNGIAIYFPETMDYRKVYNEIEFSKSYEKFVNDYLNIYTGEKSFSMAINEKIVNEIDNKFSLQLTEEENNYYKKSNFMVFKQLEDGYYLPVITSNNTNKDNNGLITTNFNYKTIASVNKTNGEIANLTLIEVATYEDYTIYSTPISLQDISSDNIEEWKIINASLKLKVYNTGKIDIIGIHATNENMGNGTILNLEDYTSITFYNLTYKITDSNGNFNNEFESNPEKSLVEFKISEGFEIKEIELDKDENYVGVIRVKDLYDDVYYTDLIGLN